MDGREPLSASERVRAVALETGFDLVGIARPDPSDHDAFFREWLRRGLHGEMGYLGRPDATARREDLGRTMKTVRSVVVVGHEYFGEDVEGVPDDPSVGVIARYARGRDYHKVVKKRLLDLLGRIQRDVDPAVTGRAYVDTGPILERELAQRAGLGWFGRNTMLIHPRRGSWFFLGCLLLDIDLEPDEPIRVDHCGTCTRCLEACPTGALLGRNEDGAPVMDARRCISYLTIEHRGPIPLELRPLIGNRVFGCDICQEVCPFNERFAREASEPGYAARGPGERPVGVERLPSDEWHPGTEAPRLIDLMSMDAAGWEAFSRGSPIRRAGRAGFRRNVAVALGNWESPEAVPVLTSALSDPEPLVRGHAAWALGRVDAVEAREALERAFPSEADPFVRGELARALEASPIVK